MERAKTVFLDCHPPISFQLSMIALNNFSDAPPPKKKLTPEQTPCLLSQIYRVCCGILYMAMYMAIITLEGGEYCFK